MIETYTPVAKELRQLVDRINWRLSDAGSRTAIRMSDHPLTELKWNGLTNKRVTRGYVIKIYDVSGRIKLRCILEDVGYPQWYGLTEVKLFLEGFLCALRKDTQDAVFTNIKDNENE